MALWDVFTGAPAKEAAGQQRTFLDQTRTTGNADILGGLDAARGYITGAGTAANSALGTGYTLGTGAVGAGADQALGYLGSGTTNALGRLDQAGGAYDSLSALGSKYGGATSLALGGLGVNGQPGIDAARGAFQAGPAYNFNLDQGIEAINRRRNAGGMLNSGNADRDAQVFGAGLASNEYDKWMNQLLGFTNPELSATAGAASGQAGVDIAGANLLNQQGINQAGVATQRGAMLADLGSRFGTGMADVSKWQGGTLAGLETGAAGQKVGLATALASPYAGTYKQEADAEMAGSGALWQLGLGAANLGLKASGVGGFAAPAYRR